MKRTILLMALVATACDGDKKATGAGGGAKGADIGAGVTAANAAVPAAMKDKLVFEAGKGEDDKAEIVVPKGWKTDIMPGSFEPPDGSDLGFMTRYSVSDNCDGMCQAKDWKATAEKVEFAQFRRDGFKIEKEEDVPGGHLVVAKSDEKTYLAVAWWKDDARSYWVCRATLDGDIAAALPAFEAACRATNIVKW